MSGASTRSSWPTWVFVGSLAVWGVVHVVGGASLLLAGARDGLLTLGASVADSVPTSPGAATAALLQFHSLNVLLGGVAVLGLLLAWRRRRRDWHLGVALAVAVALDVGLIAFMLVPGVMPLSQGFIGPALVLVALVAGVPMYLREGAGRRLVSG